MDPLSFKLGVLDALETITEYVSEQNIVDGAVTEAKLSFSPATTGKAIAMAIVFGG